MKLNKISLNDKEIFSKYLNLSRHELSVYTFENIYIWRGLFDIYWVLINDSLCVFFRDRIGFFMYLPALSPEVKPQVLKEAFGIMDFYNKNKQASRIENIEEKDRVFYQEPGYECVRKYPEYLCKRTDLVQLKGNKFKSKRSCVNYFIKNYKFQYLPFLLNEKNGCLGLFDSWKRERMGNSGDSIYLGMLEDGRVCLKSLLDSYEDLDITGRIVKIGGLIRAFTFGFKLNKDTFCVLFEVTDLSIKGLAQFIFRQLCVELKDYKYINIMDDSGLENLKKVKLSYQPARLIPAYIARRKNA